MHESAAPSLVAVELERHRNDAFNTPTHEARGAFEAHDAVADSLDCARNCKHHTKKRTRDCEICVRMSLMERCARRGF